MFMVIAGMLIMIIFMTMFSEVYQDNLRNKKSKIFEDLGFSLQNELIMASQVHTGYKRLFNVPVQLEGFDYKISINNTMLLIDYTENVFALPIPAVTGTFVKGINVIINQDNKVLLN